MSSSSASSASSHGLIGDFIRNDKVALWAIWGTFVCLLIVRGNPMEMVTSKTTIAYDTSFVPYDNIGSTISIKPFVILEDSPLLSATGLRRRKAIEIIVATATVATTGLTAVFSSNSAVQLYDNIAAKIKAKSEKNSCTLTYGTEYDGGVYAGYAFKATMSGSECDTPALEKTIKNAVEECANRLHNGKAVVECCRFSHGGTWTGHLRLTAAPDKFPAKDVDC